MVSSGAKHPSWRYSSRVLENLDQWGPSLRNKVRTTQLRLPSDSSITLGNNHFSNQNFKDSPVSTYVAMISTPVQLMSEINDLHR